jgi:Ca-activated chloride channel family protein
VTTLSMNAGALTGPDGRYSIVLPGDGLLGREVTLDAVLIGYATERRTVTLSAATTAVDLALTPTAIAVREIIATPTAAEADRALWSGAMPQVLLRGRGARQVLPGRYNPDFNTESYALIAENPFLAVGPNPLSTFSIDVDRASFANVRRFINEGRRPPVDAVRIEELVNYFPYADPAPTGEHPFSVTTEVSRAPWQPLHHLVRIGIKGREVDVADLPASNLVFLLDVSGSMSSPDKLPLLKRAFGMLVENLRPRDRVAIVVYAGAAGLVLPSTPGSDKDDIMDALARLEAGGSTAGGAGIRLAYDVARHNHIPGGNNRVILATDGDFNVGASSDAEMVRLIEEKREQGTFLTVLGFGTGNLKDSRMEQLADHGNGNFAYIDSPLEARKVLVSEMGGTLLAIAKDVKLQVEFNPTRVRAYRLIGYENRLLANEDFADDTKDAGELGAGHSVTALYEVVPVGVESPVEVRGVDSLRYRSPEPAPTASATDEIFFLKLRYKDPDGTESRLVEHVARTADLTGTPSTELRFAAAVAGFGMLLRNSEHAGSFTLADVSTLAREAVGDDPSGYRAAFVGLVDRARSLELLALRPGG